MIHVSTLTGSVVLLIHPQIMTWWNPIAVGFALNNWTTLHYMLQWHNFNLEWCSSTWVQTGITFTNAISIHKNRVITCSKHLKISQDPFLGAPNFHQVPFQWDVPRSIPKNIGFQFSVQHFLKSRGTQGQPIIRNEPPLMRGKTWSLELSDKTLNWPQVGKFPDPVVT